MHKYGGELIYQSRSIHGMIEVTDDTQFRSLHFGTDTCQSSMLKIQPGVLVLAYTRSMMASLLFIDKPEKILCIGLGAGSMMQFTHLHYPYCQIDVVELRQDVIDVAEQFFELKRVTHLNIFQDDGVHFIKEAPANTTYDLILIDAYTASQIETSVSTEDYFRRCRKLLKENGVVAINLSRLQKLDYKSALRNMRRVFPRSTMRLPVIEKANEIVFGLKQIPDKKLSQSITRRAELLKQHHGIEYDDFLKVLQRDNPDILRT